MVVVTVRSSMRAFHAVGRKSGPSDPRPMTGPNRPKSAGAEGSPYGDRAANRGGRRRPFLDRRPKEPDLSRRLRPRAPRLTKFTDQADTVSSRIPSVAFRPSLHYNEFALRRYQIANLCLGLIHLQPAKTTIPWLSIKRYRHD